MAKLTAWIRGELPTYLKGSGCGAWLGALLALLFVPDTWFLALAFAAWGGICYSAAVNIERIVHHQALMVAPSVWVPAYELKGEIIQYDENTHIYQVWTPAHGSVSSGWFKADMLEPLDSPLSVEEGGAGG